MPAVSWDISRLGQLNVHRQISSFFIKELCWRLLEPHHEMWVIAGAYQLERNEDICEAWDPLLPEYNICSYTSLFSPFLQFPFRLILLVALTWFVLTAIHQYREDVTEDTSTSTESQKGLVHLSSWLDETLIQSQGIYFQNQDLSFSKLRYNFSALGCEENANVRLASFQE